jgi:hypothetical protein
MRFARSSSLMIYILIINLFVPAPLLAQSGPAQRPRNRQQASLAAAISELLKLAPLPPASPDHRATNGISNRSDEDKKPPADDAPIGKLIEYWSRYSDAVDKGEVKKPPEKVSYRLLEACEDRPWLLEHLTNLMPETADASDRLYRLFTEENGKTATWKDSLHHWLMLHSNYFRDELIVLTHSVGDQDPDKALEVMKALARLDWEVAKPWLERLAGTTKPNLSPLALSLLHAHAVEKNDESQSENYRKQLKEMVTYPLASEDSRVCALYGLISTEWSGQEEWVVSLFKDPVLNGIREAPDGSDSKEERDEISKQSHLNSPQRDLEKGMFWSSLLSMILSLNLDKWIPAVAKLIGNDNRTVHNGAVIFLNDYFDNPKADKQLRREAARQLLPWLTDADWSLARGRAAFISSLADLELPESVPGLIWILENDESDKNCAAAASALCAYRNPSAIPALRRALEREKYEPYRWNIVTALALSGGFSDDEMAEAIEAYAGIMSESEGEEEANRSKRAGNEKPLPLKVSIGRILHDNNEFQVTEGLAARLFARVDELRSKQPEMAKRILNKIRAAPFRIAEVKLIERISGGTAEIDDLTLALKTRGSLRNSVAEELHAMARQKGYLSGIAAAVLNDRDGIDDLLAGKDEQAQLALLACARYLRDKLPIDLVARLLNSSARALAKTAENYLEVEDGAEARKLIIAKHPREAPILGDLHQLNERQDIRQTVDRWEERMRRQVLSQKGLDEIYSVLFPWTGDNFSGVVIRVSGGKAELSLSEVEGRRRVRLLSDNEFQELKHFTSRQEVDDLGPESWNSDIHGYRSYYVYLRLTREGGRRILLDHFERTPKNPTLHEELSGLFYKLTNSGQFKELYALEDKVPGLEVMMADDKQWASMVCMEGRQVLVLAGDRRFSASIGPEWRPFSSGQLGSATDEPSACRLLDFVSIRKKVKLIDFYFDPGERIPFSRSGDTIVFTNYPEKEEGIWKVEPGSEPVKILSGNYSTPLLIDNKKLLFAVKNDINNGQYNQTLIRYNTETGQESVIAPPQEGFNYPVAYLPDHGKILVTNAEPNHVSSQSLQNYLLDPESGIMQPVKGDFRPLFDQNLRPLQSTRRPHEYWTALYDHQKRVTAIGRYNAKSFVFKPLLDLNDIQLRNADIWADVETKKLWFTYEGHLLRLPLPEGVK